jgi:hypothetical protein
MEAQCFLLASTILGRIRKILIFLQCVRTAIVTFLSAVHCYCNSTVLVNSRYKILSVPVHYRETAEFNQGEIF